MANSQSWDFHVRHFSAPRLNHYLTACADDRNSATALYEWNSTIGAAFWESLGHLEVAMRNSIDRRMDEIHRARGRSDHWIFDTSRQLGRDARGPGQHKHPYLDAHTAIGRVRRNGMPLDPGQVISELSFGFWHQMVSKSQRSLWPDLVAAFPSAPNRSQTTVHDPVGRLRALRNRIGHHHRIWSLDLDARYEDLLSVAGFIDPDLSAWIGTQSRVPCLLTRRPVQSTAPPGRLGA